MRGLLEHRQVRERAIMDAIGQAPRTTIGLVDALYPQIDPMLRRAAERNVVAHLHKLEAEGAAANEGNAWRARR